MNAGIWLIAASLVAATSSNERGDTTELRFSVANPGGRAVQTVARVSMPVPPQMLRGEPSGTVTLNDAPVPAQGRVITRHPDGSVRRLMLSFPVDLAARETRTGSYDPKVGDGVVSAGLDGPAPEVFRAGPYRVALPAEGDEIRLLTLDEKVMARVRPFGPELGGAGSPHREVLETGPSFVWLRWIARGSAWSREVDVQVNRFGEIRLVHRLQRRLPGDAWCPDFGFEIAAPGAKPGRLPDRPVRFGRDRPSGRFAEDADLCASLALVGDGQVSLANPLALRQNRGTLETVVEGDTVMVRSSRLERVDDVERDGLMIQEGQWRVSQLVIAPGPPEMLAARVDDPIATHADWRAYDAVYHTGPPLRTDDELLRLAVEKHVQAIEKMSVDGDDWGNMTSWSPGQKRAPINSMVRYNHCQYVWEDYFRTGDPRLDKIAGDWSENYRNLSVYWGPQEKYYGGSRRGRAWRDKPGSPHGPGTYMVRFDYVRGYVTKGFHNFWLAYEETGDPRFHEAAVEQAKWSAENVHCDQGEMRNVGVITDFVKLYEYRGDDSYLHHAVRLWEEFQSKQGSDLLFTQSGRPAVGNHLYVPDDQSGYQHPFVKPYIVQYATNSLPYLLRHRPDDRRLRDTILALNDWMARVQGPAGGWGYPGPTTAGPRWYIEYVHGMMLAYAIEPKDAYLDAVARDLRFKLLVLEHRGDVPSRLEPWESVAGIDARKRQQMYKLGTDRDPSKDFTDGRLRFGHSPDGTVYFQQVLREYLKHRDEASLFETNEILEQIKKLPASEE